jgi:hypothetical protein
MPLTGRECLQDCETSRIPHFLDNRFTEGGEVVILTLRPAFTPRKTPGILISVRDGIDSRAIVRLEGLGQMENTVTSSGIEPATFRRVAQCLYKLRYACPSAPFNGYGENLTGVKRLERGAYHSPPSRDEVKNGGAHMKPPGIEPEAPL